MEWLTYARRRVMSKKKYDEAISLSIAPYSQYSSPIEYTQIRVEHNRNTIFNVTSIAVIDDALSFARGIS
jgi:hypothetical protein